MKCFFNRSTKCYLAIYDATLTLIKSFFLPAVGKLSTTKTVCYKVGCKWHHQIYDSVCFLCVYCLFPVIHKGQAIDSSLSETGQQQAEAAGQYLRDVRFSNVFVSDMLRAKQVQCLTLKLEEKNTTAFRAFFRTLLFNWW